jgi:CRISPR/Cas system-associated exonuclease Cas4 (RecB family)
VTRIIDYKTGGTLKKISGIKSVEELFTRSGDKDYGKVFQTFYYAYLMCGEYDRIAPSLLFVRETADEHFEPYIEMNKQPVSDFSDYYDEFGEQLHALIEEIFNSDVPYTAATTDSACKYCKFLSLCGKKEEKNDY